MTFLNDIIKMKGDRYYGYACIVSNDINKKPEQTVAFQDLLFYFKYLGIYEYDIKTDKVMANVKKRPTLDSIIDELNRNDRIYITDISHLLSKTNKAREYYKKALERGIEIFIADFNHTLFRIHPLSALLPSSQMNNYIQFDVERMLKQFDDYAETYEPPRRGGRGKIVDIEFDRYDLAWEKVYFAYESYQIKLDDMFIEGGSMYDLCQQLNIKTYPTFISIAEEYERSLYYYEAVISYAELDPEFINLPKRIVKRAGGKIVLPEEYLIVKQQAEADGKTIIINENNFTDEGYVERTGANNFFFINNVIYKRYQNLETMKIPKKLRDVNIFFE